MGAGTALSSSSNYSPGFSAQLMHFSLELQNACRAFVKDISIKAKYTALLCLHNRVKPNTFLCAQSMTLAIY